MDIIIYSSYIILNSLHSNRPLGKLNMLCQYLCYGILFVLNFAFQKKTLVDLKMKLLILALCVVAMSSLVKVCYIGIVSFSSII